jgi:non-heme chloroperoxidase
LIRVISYSVPVNPIMDSMDRETPVPTTVTLPDGLALSYVDQGDRSAPAVLLLHGLADSWRSFARVLPHMPRTVRSIALSQRGHGDSDKPEGGYRARDFASDAAAFLDRLNVARCVIVGHSSHGLVAQRLAIDGSDRVVGIVLESSFPTLRGNDKAEMFVNSTIPTIRDPVGVDFIRAFQAGTFVKPVPQTFVDFVAGDTLKVPARVWRAGFEGLFQEDLTNELSAVKVPTLLIWGDQDALVTRAQQDQLVTGIRDAKLIVYEGVGHSPHWEEPSRFAADLSAFVGWLGRLTDRAV